MGFYNLETLKEDARRHGIPVLNPDVNASREKCTIKDESILLGFLNVTGVGDATASRIVEAREEGGPFASLADAMERTGLQREAVENLVSAGAFDPLVPERRAALWEVGLRYRPGGAQMALRLPVEQDEATLPALTRWEGMAGEYRTLGLYPDGHLMALLRPQLGPGVLTSQDVPGLEDGQEVTVAGLVIRRQRPLSRAVFITLEDEFGHIPLMVWPRTYERYRLALREPLLKVRGSVSRRDGTLNIAVHHVETLKAPREVPKAKNWG
jgi:error-prone DNA polymerase